MIASALIFAAGRGERMRPLTDTTPKPLLQAGGKRLIEWHLENLAGAGVREVIINTSHLAEQFAPALGEGERWGLRIRYSYEGVQPLETGGGMQRALALFDADPFIAVNADIFTDFDFSTLPQNPTGLAHLVMVDNPTQHPLGDFVLRDGILRDEARPRLTFAGIGVYRRALLRGHTAGTFGIVPILRAAMTLGNVSGQHYRGAWTDVGTPARLTELTATLP